MIAASPLTIRVFRAAGVLAWCAFALAVSWWVSKAILLWDVVGLVPLLRCLALGLMVWIVLQPVIGLYLFVAVNFVLMRLVDLGWLPLSTIWLNDLVLVCWAIHVVIRSSRRKELPLTPFDVLTILLISLFIISTVANSVPPLQMLVGMRYYFKYLVAFYLMVALQFPPAILRRILIILVGLALLQVPLTLYQFIQIGGTADAVSGTLTKHGSGIMLFWQLSAASLLIGAYFAGLISARAAAVAGLCAFPPLLGGVAATIAFVPFVMACLAVPLLLTRNVRVARRYITVTVLLPILVGGLGMLVSPDRFTEVLEENTQLYGSVDDVIRYNEVETGRLASIERAWKVTGEKPLARWIGYGPGAASKSAHSTASLRKKKEMEFDATQIDFFLIEMGIPLVALTLSFVLLAYFVNLRAFWRARTRPERTVTIAMFGIIPLYAAFFVYASCWVLDATAFLFWLGVAYVLPIARRRLRPAERAALIRLRTSHVS